MLQAVAPTATTAFLAGLVSFLSPCVLPLVPTYLTYLAGGAAEVTRQSGADVPGLSPQVRRTVLVNAVMFITGFSLVFIAFGATATALGQFFVLQSPAIRKVSAVIVIALGLSMTGLLPLPWLQRDMRMQTGGSGGAAGSFLLGLSFAAGWTPCIGPILAAILALASQSATFSQGMWLLVIYSLGLAIPFFLAAVFLGRAVAWFRRLYRHFKTVQLVGGLLLIGIGFMLWFNTFTWLNSIFAKWWPV